MFRSKPFHLAYDNNIDPFIPELWSRESLAILEENMVATMMINRDFQDEVANYGDLVHTRRPGEFKGLRKTSADPVTKQDATAVDVQVPLDQHIHVSFIIKDGEQSKSFVDLVATYLKPAMLAQARILDRIVLGQYPQFLNNSYGGLGTMTITNAKGYILGTRNILNVNKAYMDSRALILTPNSETILLNLDIFTQAQQVGDQGTALREASLGRKLGFDMYMCQNMASVATGATTVSGTAGAAAAAGATTITVAGFTAAIPNGSWVTLVGDGTPQQVVSSVGGAAPTSITIYPGLKSAVANGAAIVRYSPGTVNLAAGYAVGYAKEITISGLTVPPRIGQMVSFGTGSGASQARYTIIDVNGLVGITLDRPLAAALANNDGVNIGPPGDYNLAWHPDAMTLVVRPLALPLPGTGARAGVVNNKNLSMRTTISYDGTNQGHLVTLDMLCGIAILDTNLGAVMLA